MQNLIDINQTVDLIKLKFYNEWIYTDHLRNEGESEVQKKLTKQIVENYIDPMNLPKYAHILDLGCGVGYFLDEMKEREYTTVHGVTLAAEDIAICESKGHSIKKYDISFLPQKEGYYDESVDFIFMRHALQNSPYPLLSLMEYNRVLKQGSKIYIEVPAPDCERRHEFYINNYSVLGANQWAALLIRCGFDIEEFNNLDFELSVQAEEDKEPAIIQEKYYCIVATKARPLDIK